jgi:ATP-dependent DNA helicase MPH1
VIFATPQTVANDLRRGSLRPEDIICIVVDEAHRATGAYAYCIVVKLMMRFNPHFRVLALTATPGSDPERVQAVIDNLHVSQS